ncbi:sensor histidine kinase [Herbiconiux sp. P18]|uniref:sensor histidine kinase n=1 Tax=Herbiconiux liangxiaofengii TaxID=3342795 RepID=UPI003CF5B2F2
MTDRTDARPGSPFRALAPVAALRRADSRLRADPRRADLVDALAVFALGVLLIALGSTGTWSDAPRLLGGSPWLHLAPLAVACAAMLAKRRHPLAALLTGVLAVVADTLLGGSIGVVIALFDLLFAAYLFTTAGGRRVIVRSIALVIVGAGLASLLAGASLSVTILLVLQTAALLVLPVWWADNVRQSGELAAAASERARLESERADALASAAAALSRVAEADRAEAVRAERARMARDLHDTIAGQVSVIAIQAEAALAQEPDTSRDRRTLGVARASALDSLTEMRQLITLLRDGDQDPWATAPGLEGLGEVLERSRRAGATVTFEGSLDFARTGPPSSAEQAALRIVQEALANAGKHAPGSVASVSVRREPDPARLVVEVRNPVPIPDPRAGSHPGSSPGSRPRDSSRMGADPAASGSFRAGRSMRTPGAPPSGRVAGVPAVSAGSACSPCASAPVRSAASRWPG